MRRVRADRAAARTTTATVLREIVRLRAERAAPARLRLARRVRDLGRDGRLPRGGARAAAARSPLPPRATRAREQAALQAIIDAEPEPFALEAHDWAFYTEKVRAAEYDLDRGALRPWFEAERVLQDGVFHAATELYGVTFAERADLAAYHPDARVFEVQQRGRLAGRAVHARPVHPRLQARRRVDELDRLAVATARHAADRRQQPQRAQAGRRASRRC